MQAPAAAASPVDKLLEGFWEVRAYVLRRLLLMAVDGTENICWSGISWLLSLNKRSSRPEPFQLHPIQWSQMQ
jgi:hypothetical protein